MDKAYTLFYLTSYCIQEKLESPTRVKFLTLYIPSDLVFYQIKNKEEIENYFFQEGRKSEKYFSFNWDKLKHNLPDVEEPLKNLTLLFSLTRSTEVAQLPYVARNYFYMNKKSSIVEFDQKSGIKSKGSELDINSCYQYNIAYSFKKSDTSGLSEVSMTQLIEFLEKMILDHFKTKYLRELVLNCILTFKGGYQDSFLKNIESLVGNIPKLSERFGPYLSQYHAFTIDEETASKFSGQIENKSRFVGSVSLGYMIIEKIIGFFIAVKIEDQKIVEVYYKPIAKQSNLQEKRNQMFTHLNKMLLAWITDYVYN